MRRTLMAGMLLLGLVPGARADVESGWRAYLAGDHATALREIHPRAEAGDPQAQYYMGTLVDAGAGVRRDLGTAAAWYERAAAQGHAGAQFALGMLYYNGAGDGSVPRDPERAIRWLAAAGQQGSAYARYLVGRMFREGRGVEKDLEAAEAWCRAAAQQGVAGAQYEVGLLIAGRPNTPAERIEAYTWFLLAARQGYPGARQNVEAVAAALNQEEIAKATAAADAWRPSRGG